MNRSTSNGASLLLFMIVPISIATACGASGHKLAGSTPATTSTTRATTSLLSLQDVKRAFLDAGFPLSQLRSVDLAKLPVEWRRPIKVVLPGVELISRNALKSHSLVVIVGRNDSNHISSTAFSAIKDVRTGKIIRPSPGTVDVIHNVVVGSKLSFRLWLRLGKAIDKLKAETKPTRR